MKTPENAVVLQPPATSQRGPEIKKHETIAVYTPCSSISNTPPRDWSSLGGPRVL